MAGDAGSTMTRKTLTWKNTAVLFVSANLLFAPTAYGHDDHPHPVSARVTVQHVTKGCHELSIGGRHSASLNLTVARGHAIGVVNTDGDSFRIVQAAGPKIATGGRLVTGLMNILAFEHTGRYTFTVVRVAKSEFSMRTVGPDNTLRLRIRVY